MVAIHIDFHSISLLQPKSLTIFPKYFVKKIMEDFPRNSNLLNQTKSSLRNDKVKEEDLLNPFII